MFIATRDGFVNRDFIITISDEPKRAPSGKRWWAIEYVAGDEIRHSQIDDEIFDELTARP